MRYLLCLLIFILFCTSCSGLRSNEEEVKSLFGRKIKFNNEIVSMNSGILLAHNEEFDKKLKIVTYVPHSSCSECALRLLKIWETFLVEKPADVGFIVVIDSRDATQINQLLSKMEYKRNVCFDVRKRYIKDNKLQVRAKNKTFLLDENNKIVIVGEPLTNKNVWVVYKNAFKKLLN